MNPSSVRVRLVTPALDGDVRERRFGGGGPFAMRAGEWAGRTLDEVAAEDPEALHAWLTDPDFAPPGGESVTGLVARAGAWLASLEPGAHRVEAADQAFVRAAVVHALDLPVAAFWRLDARPRTAVELSGRAGRWNLRIGTPEGAARN
ncbi:histidine phosphatase family protein [Streptomyces sp. NRRL S-87]|uniref:histidine phosphatase family protein n=1 Tax=Streptomyces sp. NRRL S-87 TaxID=1463920 RepID=UPI0004C017ED|nr:histidine phosphatase family protein [Streptomyces sp. NRRL S-87]